MIYFFLMQNTKGRTLLARWYFHLSSDEKQKLIEQVHACVTLRDPEACNFVDFRNFKLVYYRPHHSTYVCLIVDITDNFFYHLEAIRNFCEVLGKYYPHMTQLEVVHKFRRMYVVVDEMFLGGEIRETDPATVIKRLDEYEAIRKQEKGLLARVWQRTKGFFGRK